MRNLLARYSVSLNGTDEYIDMGGVAALRFERTASFSLSIWVKTSAVADSVLIGSLGDGTTYTGYVMQMKAAGTVEVTLSSDSTGGDVLKVVTTETVNDGAWHHVAMTYNGSSAASGVQVYIDGEAATMSTTLDSLTSSIVGNGKFRIGAYGYQLVAGLLNGSVVEAAAYSKQLSAAEVRTVYGMHSPPDLTVAGPTANLVGYWPCGAGTEYKAWDPDIYGEDLTAWWDPNQGYTIGTGVNLWQPRSVGAGVGTSLDVAQATPSRQPARNPTGGMNGGPSFDFTAAASQCLLSGAYVTAQPLTLLIQAKAALGSVQTFVDSLTGNQRHIYVNSSNEAIARAGVALIMTSVSHGGDWHVYGAVYNSTTSTIRREDGQQATGNAGSANSTGMSMGEFNGSANYLDGSLGHIALVGRALTAAELARGIEGMARLV